MNSIYAKRYTLLSLNFEHPDTNCNNLGKDRNVRHPKRMAVSDKRKLKDQATGNDTIPLPESNVEQHDLYVEQNQVKEVGPKNRTSLLTKIVSDTYSEQGKF